MTFFSHSLKICNFPCFRKVYRPTFPPISEIVLHFPLFSPSLFVTPYFRKIYAFCFIYNFLLPPTFATLKKLKSLDGPLKKSQKTPGQISIQLAYILGKNPTFPGKNPTFPGKNPTFFGKKCLF